MLTHDSRRLRHLTAAMLLLSLAAASCAVMSRTSDPEAETRFRQLFGSTLTDKLLIITDKSKYQRDDTIGYRVHNTTDQTVWFQDQSFGVQAFTYDSAAKEWIELDLGFRVGDPMPKGIEPGGGGALDYYALWIERIDVPGDGKIRLVITGHTDLDNPYRDQVYRAYTDIEIVK